MQRPVSLALAAMILSLALASPLMAQDTSAQPPKGEPAQPPKGEIIKHAFKDSKIFPGTVREYSIYVPRQYDPARPACVYVNQDGVQFKAPEVFDQLIAAGQMPITIGVFVPPGRVPALSPAALDRFNRSFEYDGLGDAYVRFLLDELLPDVEKQKAADGREIRLSKSGNDRAIGGSSSGAVCAFTAAWERPDAFSRVFSAIGTYVGLRGANEYPTLIRKVEPKPLRVFLQDGSSDLNIYGGDWWMVNQEMERALVFAGYEVNHSWGDGGHNGKHATEIFPDAMRWLWKDWPAPIKAGAGSQQMKDVLVPGETWKPVEGDYKSARALAVNAKGEVFFNDLQLAKNWIIGLDGQTRRGPTDVDFVIAQAFGPDGKRDAMGDAAREKVAAIHWTRVLLHSGAEYSARLVANAGPGVNGLWYLSAAGDGRLMDPLSGIDPAGIFCSPDHSLLYLSDGGSRWVYSYQIRPDGSLANGQRYYHLHLPDALDGPSAGGLRVDRDGRLYVATPLGVQICDQAGRVNCILPTPARTADEARSAGEIEFGGERFDTVFVTRGDRIYRRKLNVRGAPAFEPPHKPSAPKL